MKTDVTLRDVSTIRVERRDDSQFWMRFGDYSYEMVTIFADGEARETLNRWAGNDDILKQRDALLPLAERVSKLNPDAGEIGEGMLRQLVEEANAALAICDESESPK